MGNRLQGGVVLGEEGDDEEEWKGNLDDGNGEGAQEIRRLPRMADGVN